MGFSAAFALLALMTPPLVYSRFLIAYQAVNVFLVAIIMEAYLHSRVARFGLAGIDQPAMMVFIFANMIALAVRYARMERELLDMTELNHMKTEFLNQASHGLMCLT